MKYFFISALISTCMLCVWSQNFQISPSNLRYRRQKEIGAITDSIAKGSSGDQLGVTPNFEEAKFQNRPPTDQSSNDSSQNLRSHLTRRQAESEEQSDAVAVQPLQEEIEPEPIVSETDAAVIVPKQKKRPLKIGPIPTEIAAQVTSQQETSFKVKPSPTHQSSSPAASALPSGSEVGITKTNFSCIGRIYGYYADPENCQVFYKCVPYRSAKTGLNEISQFSFVCGYQTVFDQASLSCNSADESLPCSEASSMYDLGRT